METESHRTDAVTEGVAVTVAGRTERSGANSELPYLVLHTIVLILHVASAVFLIHCLCHRAHFVHDIK